MSVVAMLCRKGDLEDVDEVVRRRILGFTILENSDEDEGDAEIPDDGGGEDVAAARGDVSEPGSSGVCSLRPDAEDVVSPQVLSALVSVSVSSEVCWQLPKRKVSRVLRFWS